MRRHLASAALVAVALAAGAGGAIAFAETTREDEVQVIEVPVGTTGSSALAIEDGIPRPRAEELATAATKRVPGKPVSVEAEDGAYEVEVYSTAGGMVEVLLDAQARVVGVDQSDG